MLLFEKEYYERPLENESTQCDLDLQDGKIGIVEVPFEYRDMKEYVHAEHHIGNIPNLVEREVEQEVLKSQLIHDIAECKRMHKKEKQVRLFAVYEAYFADGANYACNLANVMEKEQFIRRHSKKCSETDLENLSSSSYLDIIL